MKIDFRSSIKLIVTDVDGVLTNGGIYISDSGEQMRRFYVRDGLATKMLLEKGYQIGILSAALTNGSVETRAKMLGVKLVYAGSEKKLDIIETWIKKLKLHWNEIAYIGDDIIDLDVLKKAGFSACPADAINEVKQVVHVVLNTKGGYGCFREFADRFFLFK